LIILSTLFTNCTKTKDLITEESAISDANNNLEFIEIPAPEDLGNGATENVIFGKIIVNGTNFKHIYQKTIGVTCGGQACLPTSYMIARAVVYPNRNFSVQELNSIVSTMGTSCTDGTSISKCQSYAKSDLGTCNPSIPKTKIRDEAKNYIKNNLEKGLPIITLVSIKGGTSTSSPNYISEVKAFGHFVTIVGLELTTTESGSKIFYIDPLDQTKTLRETSYKTYLNSCLSASSSNLYNIIAIGCEVNGVQSNYYGGNTSIAPTLLSPINNSQNISIPVSLNWQNATAGTIYRIQISKSLSGWTALNGFLDNVDRVMNQNTSTYNSTTFGSIGGGVTEAALFNTTYYWTVKSYVNGVSSNYSTPQVFKTANQIITAPVATSATNITTNGFKMNWSGQSPLAVGYYHTIIATDINFTNTLSNWQQNVTYPYLSWNSLNSNTWYYYRIKIVTPTGESPWSNVISVKTN
ncbi:MAG: hypothetical protein ABL929_05905, partial [Ferruginibacter sp.]